MDITSSSRNGYNEHHAGILSYEMCGWYMLRNIVSCTQQVGSIFTMTAGLSDWTQAKIRKNKSGRLQYFCFVGNNRPHEITKTRQIISRTSKESSRTSEESSQARQGQRYRILCECKGRFRESASDIQVIFMSIWGSILSSTWSSLLHIKLYCLETRFLACGPRFLFGGRVRVGPTVSTTQ